MTTPKPRRGQPLKSGEKREPWAAKLPPSTQQKIRELAEARTAERKARGEPGRVTQADIVIEAIDSLPL